MIAAETPIRLVRRQILLKFNIFIDIDYESRRHDTMGHCGHRTLIIDCESAIITHDLKCFLEQ